MSFLSQNPLLTTIQTYLFKKEQYPTHLNFPPDSYNRKPHTRFAR